MDTKRCIHNGKPTQENPRFMMGRPKGKFEDPKEGWEVYDTHEDSFASIGMDRHDLIGFVVSEANENEETRELTQMLISTVLSVGNGLEHMIKSKTAPKEVLSEMLKDINAAISKVVAWNDLADID
jgi:hypothetical protein